MGPFEENRKKYAICPPRIVFKFQPGEESSKEVTNDYRVIPLYEKAVYERAYKKHYSLESNANLKCAWNVYKQNFYSRVFAPFQFPEHRDIHFYNSAIRYAPSETIVKQSSFKRSLKPGPGVDGVHGTQLPIPQNLLMKRGTIAKDSKNNKLVSKEKS